MDFYSQSPSEFEGPGPLATGIEHILVVCTGNVCRSPLGEVALRARLADTGITVSSAGVFALEGQGVDAGMLPEFESRGLDSREFVAHQVDAEDVEDADLILTMSRRQRAFILEEWPAARQKVLLMSTASDLAREIDELSHAFHEGPHKRHGRNARAIHQDSSNAAAAAHAPLLIDAIHSLTRRSQSGAVEIPDPYRKSAEHYAQSAIDVVGCVDQFAELIRQEITKNTVLGAHE